MQNDRIEKAIQDNDLRALQALIDEARESGNEDLRDLATDALLNLKTEKYEKETSLVKDVERGLAVYEELLRRKHGRRVVASRTRKMIADRGYKEALVRIVHRGNQNIGFEELKKADLPKFSFEQIVLDHSIEFDEGTLLKARAALNGIK